MSQQDLERWREEALALPAEDVHSPTLPIAVFLLEGDGMAAFVEHRWEPSADGKLPGLKNAKTHVTRQHAADITSLVGAGRTVNALALYPNIAVSDRPALAVEADNVLLDLGAAIEITLDDNIHERADDAWAAAKSRASDDATLATKIQALEDCAEIAEELGDRLAELEDYQPGWVSKAREIAKKLSAGGSPKGGLEASAEIDLRNRIFVLIERKIAEVRGGARYVYRRHPAILREVTSQYERRRRLEARRLQKKQQESNQPQG